MKKKVTALAAMVLILLMGTTVLASPSIDKDSADSEILKEEMGSVKEATGQTPDGNTVEVSITEVESTVVVAEAKQTASLLVSEIAPEYQSKMIGIVDVITQIPDNYISINVTFYSPEVKMGDNIIVIHKTTGGEWERVYSKILRDGEIMATFTSFSPVAIVKIEEKPTEDNKTEVEDNNLPGSSTGNAGSDTGNDNPSMPVNPDSSAGNDTPNMPVNPDSNSGDDSSNIPVNPDSATGNNSNNSGNASDNSSNQNQPQNNGNKPQTGDNLPIMGFVVMLCLGGILVLGRKVITK